MKSCLQDTVMEVYSVENEQKSSIADRFIRTLKNKFYKCMT